MRLLPAVLTVVAASLVGTGGATARAEVGASVGAAILVSSEVDDAAPLGGPTVGFQASTGTGRRRVRGDVQAFVHGYGGGSLIGYITETIGVEWRWPRLELGAGAGLGQILAIEPVGSAFSVGFAARGQAVVPIRRGHALGADVTASIGVGKHGDVTIMTAGLGVALRW